MAALLMVTATQILESALATATTKTKTVARATPATAVTQIATSFSPVLGVVPTTEIAMPRPEFAAARPDSMAPPVISAPQVCFVVLFFCFEFSRQVSVV